MPTPDQWKGHEVRAGGGGGGRGEALFQVGGKCKQERACLVWIKKNAVKYEADWRKCVGSHLQKVWKGRHGGGIRLSPEKEEPQVGEACSFQPAAWSAKGGAGWRTKEAMRVPKYGGEGGSGRERVRGSHLHCFPKPVGAITGFLTSKRENKTQGALA